MPQPPEGKHPHILLNGYFETSEYTRPNRGGSSGFSLPNRERAAHSQRLLDQLQRARERETEIIESQQAIGLDAQAGIYIEFESDPEFELKFESLEFRPSGIELCLVKTIDNRNLATVFVPEGKLEHFLRRITQYQEENTKPDSDIPKHKELVESISNIRVASLEALWTDDPALFPDEGEEIWWEVWLRENDKIDYEELAREHLDKMQLNCAPESIKFIDRTIILVRGTRERISDSILLLGSIAELRKAKEPASFFLGLDRNEEREWIADLVDRTIPPPADSAFVCLLDTGINQAHPLLANFCDTADVHSYDAAWGGDDRFGHGTQMAGLALYGDLTEALAHPHPVNVLTKLESVKIIESPGALHDPQLYGAVTRESVSRVEIGEPRLRSFCLAVTATDGRDRGKPSSWSASLDALSSGYEDEQYRLFVVSAGNTDTTERSNYPDSNFTDSVHDPGQSWNALTVGAFTMKDNLDTYQYPGWTVIAPSGDISPSSCTSMDWSKAWPIKPEIVMEGGNMGRNPVDGTADYIDENLQLVSTHHNFALNRHFVSFGDTSGATALASKYASEIQTNYPDYWPETIKALLIHSAEWTDAMKARFDLTRQQGYRQLLKYCGFGTPNIDKLMWSTQSSLTVVCQDELQPYQRKDKKKPSTREINVYELPWPDTVLQEVPPDTPVELKVTLVYFVEPNPGGRGWSTKFQYASHGLRFEVRRPLESLDTFKARINQKARDEELRRVNAVADTGNWILGEKLRTLGSVHSDTWSGNASELIARKNIAIYPVGGWWKERITAERWHKTARYSLIVSLSTPTLETEMYTEISQQIENVVEI